MVLKKTKILLKMPHPQPLGADVNERPLYQLELWHTKIWTMVVQFPEGLQAFSLILYKLIKYYMLWFAFLR